MNTQTKPILKLLVANRGEIAIRILRAAEEMGIATVAIYSEDDLNSLHTLKGSESVSLKGTGPEAYLNIEQIIDIAKESGCDAIHPGYGFLSENATFARRCVEEGISFVGPDAKILALLGDKTQARSLAENCNIPVLPGLAGPVTLDQVKGFFTSLGENNAIIIKAVSGGGGRGMRVVNAIEEIDNAFSLCQSEARQAFGDGDLYVEQYKIRARHIEVQIVGDGTGEVSHLGERECSIQRSHQKLVEISPCPGLNGELRDRLLADAIRLGQSVHYRNLGTIEFLVDENISSKDASYAFIEANTRLQVEHTVTEEVMNLDLVKVQLQLASGRSLAEIGLDQAQISDPNGYAMQVRINMESMHEDGAVIPSGGTLTTFETPLGKGIRTDTYGYAGYQTNPYFDSLLAKLICHSPTRSFDDTIRKTYRALCEFKVEGVETNIGLLQNLLQHADFTANSIHVQFLEKHARELTDFSKNVHKPLFFSQPADQNHTVGATVDENDPLAILAYGKSQSALSPADSFFPGTDFDESSVAGDIVISAMQGTIVSIGVKEGDPVQKGQQLLVMSAMKMEHVIEAPLNGTITKVIVSQGDTVSAGQTLVTIEEGIVEESAAEEKAEVNLDLIRPDLAEVIDRQRLTLDESRPEAIEKRHRNGQRTARENVADLCDAGSFNEYGSMIVAAQKKRRSMDDLIRKTPADGLVTGIGRVNGHMFSKEKSRSMIVAYDYTVLAGTQGMWNHQKKDRMLELAEKHRIPLFLFSEGGGGRPGDVDAPFIAGLNCRAFYLLGKLSGLVPLVGINSGRCFAGNAVLLSCCDVVIATKNSNIGLGGPAMVEGGGLGVFKPEDIGPVQVQVPNGDVDIAVEDEAEAVKVAKQYISYFQGATDDWECADQRLLRNVIPENRLRIYDIRRVIDTLADTGSVLELRRHFGVGMVTSFIRIEGRPMGVIANNPVHLSGAVDAPGSDKAARFMKLCDAFDIPLLFLCDTPGFMVGPESEKTAMLRRAGRLFVNGANLSVPYITVVLRKGYGLGAQAMAGGSFHAPLLTVSWPTGEFGAMGLEGAVKLGFRRELAAIEDPAERVTYYQEMVDQQYTNGKAINFATHFELDNVIDPADSRQVITNAFDSIPAPPPRIEKKHPSVDTW
ncbi:MAG: biotin/lipoyl-binding protein [Deltaproteobacteria bacterium]|nr:biotin/lipoyl-binding protein [Deltaproteobacteria bacterium]MBT4644685.1 biotin/lipoyl-binding protein [Deltaproteobacteria bacterium]MBT7153828.1 biotin/lipoyl-binding protein [Deltaproteobacteria bacterium]MBT7711402.1 biotin/lipoyl-binding protein [Deltaproteobacteria bacterium]